MIVDDNLIARNIVWDEIKQEAINYMDGRFFNNNKVYHFHFRIDPTDKNFRRLPNLELYRIKGFYDIEANKATGNKVEFDEATAITIEDNIRSMGDVNDPNYSYYLTHGNEFLIPTQVSSFNLNLKLFGAKTDSLKQSIETKLKVFYMSLFDSDVTSIYESMKVLKDSYKNIIEEISDNNEIQKKSYAKVKLYRI